MDLKFTHVIVDREEAREVLWRMRGLNYAINEIPLVTYTAPSYASTEIGRAYTDELIREGRLQLDETEAILSEEHETGSLALQCAVCFLKDSPSYYAPLRQLGTRGPNRPLGFVGLE